MKLVQRIRRTYRDKGLDSLWKWATDAALKVKRNRFRALTRWARKRRKADPGGGWYKRWKVYKEWWRKFARRLKKRREENNTPSSCTSPGDPCWGGCRQITDQIIRIVGGRAYVTSRKRTETYGNPGSDHHVSQTFADAVDFGTANNYLLRNEVMHKLGVPGTISDYAHYYIYRNGLRYRVQPIAGTHGTGPHLHFGVARA